MKKTISLILCIAMIMSTMSFCFPAMALEIDFGVESAEDYAQTPEETAGDASLMVANIISTVSGHNGKTVDVDPRYPGAYYKLPDGYTYAEDTVTLDNIGISNVYYYDLEDDGQTLVLFPKADTVRLGGTYAFAESRSYVKAVNATGDEEYVILPAVTYTLAKSIPDDGQNLLPYGDYENGFAPLAATNGNLEASLTTDENGNSYVQAVDPDPIWSGAGAGYPHISYNAVMWEDGATYYFAANFKHLGVRKVEGETHNDGNVYIDFEIGAKGTATGSVNVNGATKNEFTGNNTEKTVELSKAKDWISFDGTITFDTSSDSGHKLSFYSNTSSGKNLSGATVHRYNQFAFDNLEVYKRIDVVYESGDYTTLAEGDTAPARTGVYLAGPKYVEGETSVTIAEMPYTANEGVVINAEKPWVDKNTGTEYAVGEEVALTSTLYLVPNVTSVGEKAIYTVTFAGSVNGLPEAMELAEGTVVDLTEYYTDDVTSTVTGKRFNGWTLTEGSAVPVESFTVTADTTVYAIVNYDYNFAIPANNNAWDAGKNGNATAKAEHDLENGLLIVTGYGDWWALRNGISIPATAVENMEIYGDVAGMKRAGETVTVAVDDQLFQTVYWALDGGGWKGDQSISGANGKVSEIIDGKYAKMVFPVSLKGSKWTNGSKVTGFRLDPQVGGSQGANANDMVQFAFRYIHFVAPKTVESSVALTDLAAPVLGETPDTAVTVPSTIKAAAVNWTPATTLGTFEGSTAYTANITLIPANGYSLDARTAVTIDGNAAVVTDNGDGTITASYTFEKTASSDNFEIILNTENTSVDMENGTIISDGTPITFTVAATGEDAEAAIAAGIVAEARDEKLALVEVDGTNVVVTPINEGTLTLRVCSKRDVYNYTDVTFDVTVAEGCKVVNISFAGELADSLPAGFTRIGNPNVATVDLSEYLGIKTSAAGKRFNGWSATGEIADIVTGKTIVTEDTTFNAVINYDWNYAIQRSGWSANDRITGKYEDDMLKFTHVSGKDHDVYLTANTSIPGGRVYKVTFYFDANYSTYPSNPHDATVVPTPFTMRVGDGIFECIYFGFGEGASSERRLGGKVDAVYDLDGDENADIAKASFSTATPLAGTWQNGKTLTMMRFDTSTANNGLGGTSYCNMNIRYIAIEDEPVYAETVEITDIAAPVTGIALDTTAAVNAGTVTNIEWSDLSETGLAKGNTQHEVTLTLAPASGFRYDDNHVFTLEGATLVSSSVNNDADGVATVTFKFPATAEYADFDLTIDGKDSFATDGTKEYYTAVFSGDAVTTEEVIWSVSDETVAVIDENGALTPYKEGTVTVYAKSAYNNDVIAEKEVNITLADASDLITVTFVTDGAEEDNITVTRIKGDMLDLTEFYDITPTDPSKRFNGWSKTGKLADLATGKIKVVDEGNQTMTLYAIINHDWNFAIPGYVSTDNTNATGWAFNGGTVKQVGDTMYFAAKAASGSTDTFVQINLDNTKAVPVNEYKGIALYYEDEVVLNKTSTVKLSEQDNSNLDNFHFQIFKTDGTASSWVTDVKSTTYDFAGNFDVVKGDNGVTYTGFVINLAGHSSWADGMKLHLPRHDVFINSKGAINGYLRYVRLIPYDEYEADIALELTAPKAGEAPAATATDANGTATATVAWKDADGADVTTFEAGKKYTATISLSVADSKNYIFRDDVKATVNGAEVAVVVNEYNRTATATVELTALSTGLITSETGSYKMYNGTTKLNLLIKAPAEGETLTVTVDNENIATVEKADEEVAETELYVLSTVDTAGTVTVKATYTAADNTVTAIAEQDVRVFHGTKYHPGINMITGTADPETFEGLSMEDTATGSYVGNGETEPIFRIGPSKIGVAETGNNAIIYDTNDQTKQTYPHIGFIGLPTVEADRPLRISGDYVSTVEEKIEIIRNRDNQVTPVMGTASINVTTEWTPFEITKTVSKNYVSGKTQFADNEDKSVSRVFIMVNAMPLGNVVKIDNISIVPYYKITYHVGEAETVVYDLPADGIYTVDLTKLADGYTGFALTEGGEAVNTVTLANADIDLYAVAGNILVSGDETISVATIDGVIPNPSVYGLEHKNFVAWYDADGKIYYEGDNVTAEEMAGKTLTAFCQSVDAPAMGMAHEGTTSFTGAYATTDDGRTVARYVANRTYSQSADTTAYNKNFHGGIKWDGVRRYFNASSRFDPSEYTIVQAMAKHTDLLVMPNSFASTADDITDGSYIKFRIITQSASGGLGSNYVDLGDKNPRFFPADGKYHAREFDMRDILTTTEFTKWVNYGGYGLAWDISYPSSTNTGNGTNQVIFNSDTYIDYLRVYRRGIFTVNYDTNAPEGATVITDVAPDLNRGVGTGYLLKGERPEVEGYKFMGWAISKAAAEKGIAVDSIDLTGDATVYAIWSAEKSGSVTTDETYKSVRNDRFVSGFRTKATIANSFKNTIDEYGFLAAKTDNLKNQDDEGLTFNSYVYGKSASAPAYVSRTAYEKVDGVVTKDVTKDLGDGNVSVTAVIDYTNVDVSFYATNVTIRPYAKFTMANGAEIVAYGTAKTTSLYDEATALKDSPVAAISNYANEVIAEYDEYVASQVTEG